MSARFLFSRFPVGQEDRRQPTQEGGERQNPHRQHWHGHGQDQGKKPHCLITTRGQQRLPLWPFIKYPPTCERVSDLWLQSSCGLHGQGGGDRTGREGEDERES